MRSAHTDRSMDLTHQQAQELIQKSFQARLEGFERASLETHLAGCADCAAYAAEARGLHQRLSVSLPERWPEPRYSAAEMQRRQVSIQSRLRRNTMLKNVSSFARLAGTAAVLLVVIAGLGWLALRGAPRPLVGGGLPHTATPAPTRLIQNCEYPRHLVVEGETLASIAARYGVEASVVQQQNQMRGAQISVGQVLVIPTCEPVSALPTTPGLDQDIMHSVDEGETCQGIAFQYGISVDALIRANALTADCELSLGQVLRIPRPTPVSTAEEAKAGRLSLEEAEQLVRQYVFNTQPGMNPDATFPLEELTSEETWQRMRVQVYKVREGVQQYQAYAVGGGMVYPIGESFGGLGVHTLLVTDLNADSAPELVYAYSFGSGIAQSSIGMLYPVEGGFATTAIVDFRYLGELRLEKQDDQTVKVTGIPSSGGGQEELGRLMLLTTQLVIAPGDAKLIEFTSPDAGIAFLYPETWQPDPGQYFTLDVAAQADHEGSLERSCEWEANRADAPYGPQPVVQLATLGGREACVIMPDANANGGGRWAIFFASNGGIHRLLVDAAYARVVAQSLRYLEPLATVTPQPMNMTPQPPSLKAPETRTLGSLALSAYAVVSASEDTPAHFEYNARILDTVFPARAEWSNSFMAQRLADANAKLEPFGYKLVERQDGAETRIDLYWKENVLRDSISMFYPPSVYRDANGKGSFAMVIEDKNYQAALVQATPGGMMPLIGTYDLSNSRFTRPVMAGERLISVQRGYSADGADRVDVLQNGERIFTYTLAPSPVEEAVKTLDEWNGGWVLEVNGTLIVNGENWNQKELQADEIFNWTKIDGKPFFFFRRGGQIHAWYDGQELPMGWEEIIHYRCCEPAAFNVENSPNALWFHALKDGVWYYVEIRK